MGWVVTAWRTDRLAEWLSEEARAAASAEAERLRAAARDEASGAAASLEAIERLGVDLAHAVRAFRTGEAPAMSTPPTPPVEQAEVEPPEADVTRAEAHVRPPEAEVEPPEADVTPAPQAVPDAPPPRPRRPAGHTRRGRASLRDSPLGDLMRASSGR